MTKSFFVTHTAHDPRRGLWLDDTTFSVMLSTMWLATRPPAMDPIPALDDNVVLMLSIGGGGVLHSGIEPLTRAQRSDVRAALWRFLENLPPEPLPKRHAEDDDIDARALDRELERRGAMDAIPMRPIITLRRLRQLLPVVLEAFDGNAGGPVASDAADVWWDLWPPAG